MDVQFSNQITIYEVIALIISILALIIPLAKWAYTRFFKQAKIDFIPFGSIEVIFDKFCLPSLNIGGVFEAKNKPLVVKNIDCRVENISTNQVLNMKWCSFNSPAFQQIVGQRITLSETARPFKIKEGELHPLFISFLDSDDERSDKNIDVLTDMEIYCRKYNKSETQYEDALKDYRNQTVFLESVKAIQENNYWIAGDYTVKLNVEYNKKSYNKTYAISISEKEDKLLHVNIERAVQEILDNKYGFEQKYYRLRKDYLTAETI